MGDNYEYENNSFFDDSSNFDDSEFYESDSDASFDQKYDIPVDITKFPNYHKNDLQPNVVYYEVVRKPDGTYVYINNPFKGTMKNGKLVYENKHSDDLKMELRDNSVIFLKAYDVNRENYDSAHKKETDFLSISDYDYPYTDDEEKGGGRKKKASKSLKKFHFSSTQKHQHGGKKTVRNVTIRHGKGHKKVTYYKGNKKVSTVKKPLKSFEIELIKIGKFIPGLFKDCGCGKKHKTRKNKQRRG